jgi:hypothetical protein
MNHPLEAVRHGARRAPVIRNWQRGETLGRQSARSPRFSALTGRAVSDNVGSTFVTVIFIVEAQHCQRGQPRGAR